MKRKVAIIATFLSLILCLVFLAVVVGSARDKLNEDMLGELDLICRLSAERLDSAAFDREEAFGAFDQVAAGPNMVFTLYSPDGAALSSSHPGVDPLSAAERAAAAAGVHTFARENRTAGGQWLFAAKALEDGDLIAVSHRARTAADMIGDRALPLALLALALAAVTHMLIRAVQTSADRLVGNVLRTLEDFSEGQFDSRLTGTRGDSIEQVARFNEVIGRLQDQVLRQRTRNHALGTVINRMQNGILAVDQDLNVLLVTPAAKQLLGITGSPEGMPIGLASKDVKLDTVLTEGMHQDGVYMNEVAARTAVGRGHRPIRLYVSPMTEDGKTVGAVALVEDITELRRLEQVRTDFAANVSHELKTPLTSIKGFVETLQNGAIENPDMAQKFLRIIMLEADRLTRLINDILTVSKLESGKDAAPNERIRLDEMIDDVADMLRILAAEKDVTIACNHTDEESYVIGNADRVEQMLINLIENAIKYNRQGGSVTVSLFNGPDTLNLSIADTGIGIPEDNSSRVFERFYRVDKGRSRSMGGTGLGLSIVKHIVKSMGGMIEVHSKVGEGTEFLVTLPRASDAEESQVEKQLDDAR